MARNAMSTMRERGRRRDINECRRSLLMGASKLPHTVGEVRHASPAGRAPSRHVVAHHRPGRRRRRIVRVARGAHPRGALMDTEVMGIAPHPLSS